MREVRNTQLSDLPKIIDLFEASIRYQESKKYPVWKNYDKAAIERDILQKNHYAIFIDSEMAIVFSVCYTDKIIWRALDKGDSIYLHRIVVNPDFKGQKLFADILEWSVAHAKAKGLKAVRMDTWAANQNIINYYKAFGFSVIENFTTPNVPELPVHNRNLALTLLEYKT
ncbi:MAG TPA: GNAT family N-acetyltransferase [Chryseosolibacter sp.]